MPIVKRCRPVVAGVLVACVAVGCSEPSSYEERMKYLRKVAGQGVEVHDLIDSQEGKISKDRCEDAFDAVSDYVDKAPSDIGGGVTSDKWEKQIKLFFVDSCVSGVPRKVDAPGKDPSSSNSPSTSGKDSSDTK